MLPGNFSMAQNQNRRFLNWQSTCPSLFRAILLENNWFSSTKFDSVFFLLLLNQNCFGKVIYRSFLVKSQKFRKRARITKAKIISVIKVAKIFENVFPSKQTSKIQRNLITRKKIPEQKFQNSKKNVSQKKPEEKFWPRNPCENIVHWKHKVGFGMTLEYAKKVGFTFGGKWHFWAICGKLFFKFLQKYKVLKIFKCTVEISSFYSIFEPCLVSFCEIQFVNGLARCDLAGLSPFLW